MHEYRIEATVSGNRTLTIEDLPFQEGERVEVVVKKRKRSENPSERYPLRDTPILQYLEPFKSIAEDDWEALR